jgi:hypothetical protein
MIITMKLLLLMLTTIRQPKNTGQQWTLIREINTEIRIWVFTQGMQEHNNITKMETAMNSKTMSLKSKKRKKSTR